MRVIFSDALREHGNRGVSRGIHSKPPFRARVYALNSSPAIVRRGRDQKIRKGTVLARVGCEPPTPGRRSAETARFIGYTWLALSGSIVSFAGNSSKLWIRSATRSVQG